jgi:hypothetical protein
MIVHQGSTPSDKRGLEMNTNLAERATANTYTANVDYVSASIGWEARPNHEYH